MGMAEFDVLEEDAVEEGVIETLITRIDTDENACLTESFRQAFSPPWVFPFRQANWRTGTRRRLVSDQRRKAAA